MYRTQLRRRFLVSAEKRSERIDQRRNERKGSTGKIFLLGREHAFEAGGSTVPIPVEPFPTLIDRDRQEKFLPEISKQMDPKPMTKGVGPSGIRWEAWTRSKWRGDPARDGAEAICVRAA